MWHGASPGMRPGTAHSTTSSVAVDIENYNTPCHNCLLSIHMPKTTVSDGNGRQEIPRDSSVEDEKSILLYVRERRNRLGKSLPHSSTRGKHKTLKRAKSQGSRSESDNYFNSNQGSFCNSAPTSLTSFDSFQSPQGSTRNQTIGFQIHNLESFCFHLAL